jgi:hypothetical protein
MTQTPESLTFHELKQFSENNFYTKESQLNFSLMYNDYLESVCRR